VVKELSMKKLQMLLERLLEEVEREDEEILEPHTFEQLNGNAETVGTSTRPNARQRLRPIVQDLQSHQAKLQAEDQVRASEIARISRLSRFQEAEIRALIESLPDGVLIGTREGLSICNGSALRVLGISAIAAIREPGQQIRAFNLRWPDGRALTEAEVPFVRALNGESVIDEYLLTRPNTGEEVYLRTAAAPILDDGEIAGAVAIHTDLSELRAQAEQLRVACEKADNLSIQLQRQTAELNAVLDALPDGLFIGDLEGVRRCNAQALRQLGVEKCDELNVKIADLVERFDIRHMDSNLRLSPEETPFGRALRGERVSMNLVHTDIRTGQDRIVRSSAAPVELDGKVISAVAVDIDITNETREHLEIEALTMHLDRIVGERTREVSQSNASLAKALAEVEELKDRLEAENAYLHLENNLQYNFGEVIGESEALREVFSRIETVAPQDSTVLLLGETGTGKGMLARAIHARSPRKDRPMVMVNCASLPGSLIESELFGREKGAFTGANAQQIGRFELADKGTLFLDEIGELPLELQGKLLHAIQDKEFSRLGSPRTIKVNVRIIAATNRDLKEEVARGRFREDLFYRLNIFPLEVPPLRQHREDIPLLVQHFLRKFCGEMGKEIKRVSEATLKKLVNHSWPGNVRELENVIERAVITSQGDTLQVLDRFSPSCPEPEEDAGCPTLAELERVHILKILKRTRGRIDGRGGAAELLGLHPSTLRGRMRKQRIQPLEWAAG
jgi:formate hydrogenlyase transcriptional activator